MNDETLPVLPVVLDAGRCTDCGHCIDACPTGVFGRDADGHVRAVHVSDCHVCFLCVSDCPVDAIAVSWEAPNARHRSVYDVLGIELVPFTEAQDKEEGVDGR